ncbi:MAG: hypothetical protein GVX96_06155, partial [Bacteroidetes bacterium]|nr:hypothetical protein [Bacteroidota bacterium]
MNYWIPFIRLAISLCIAAAYVHAVYAQSAHIEGTVSSVSGEPLPFASIYSKETDLGTSSDEDGRFGFSVSPKKDQIIFQYLGFEQQIRHVDLKSFDTVVLHIRMQPLSMELEKVVVAGDRNPADEIMREVIRMRPEFEQRSNAYQAGVYIKGLYRMKDAPKSILGIEVGGLDSVLKDMPSDIIYLSETQSVYARWQSESKEEVVASKTSGMQNFPSVNRASLLDVNFYESEPEIFGQKVKSPLASNAFFHYDFAFLGQYENSAGELIHKIGVAPKRPGDPLLSGFLEIVDSEWHLEAVNLLIDGRRLKIELLDSVRIRQNFIQKDEALIPPVVQTDYRITAAAFGFEITGGFTGVKKDFIFDRDSFTLSFDRTLLSYRKDALEKDSAYWLDERPIALSPEEQLDYNFKDSISNRLNDPVYLDSVDRASNRFDPMNILSGYAYRKRSAGIRWSINSPLSALFFNPVQGWNAAVDGRFRKDWKEGLRTRSSFETYGKLQYGVSDEVWRSWGEVAFRTGMKKPLVIKLAGGYRLHQVPRERPISLNANQFSNLVFKNHFIRFYDQRFLR